MAWNNETDWNYTQVSLATFGACMAAFSIVANGLIMISILKDKKTRNTPSNILLCNLALADLLNGLVYFPIHLLNAIHKENHRNHATCQLDGFSSVVFDCENIASVMLISVERYYAVVGERPTMKQTLTAIAISWVYNIFYAILPWLGLNKYDLRISGVYCGGIWVMGGYHKLFGAIGILFFCSCSTIIYIAYYRIYRFVVDSKRNLQKHVTVAKQDNRETDLAKKMFVLIICYFVNYGWFATEFFIEVFGSVYGPEWLDAMMLLGAQFNTVVNPFLYSFINPNISSGIFEMLQCWRCCPQPVAVDASVIASTSSRDELKNVVVVNNRGRRSSEE